MPETSPPPRQARAADHVAQRVRAHVRSTFCRHYARHDVEVQITGLNSHSHAPHSTLSGQTAAAHS